MEPKRKRGPRKKNGGKAAEIVVMASQVIIAGIELYKKLKPILKRKGKKKND